MGFKDKILSTISDVIISSIASVSRMVVTHLFDDHDHGAAQRIAKKTTEALLAAAEYEAQNAASAAALPVKMNELAMKIRNDMANVFTPKPPQERVVPVLEVPIEIIDPEKTEGHGDGG